MDWISSRVFRKLSHFVRLVVRCRSERPDESGRCWPLDQLRSNSDCYFELDGANVHRLRVLLDVSGANQGVQRAATRSLLT